VANIEVKKDDAGVDRDFVEVGRPERVEAWFSDERRGLEGADIVKTVVDALRDVVGDSESVVVIFGWNGLNINAGRSSFVVV
jgi:hypothetical protein